MMNKRKQHTKEKHNEIKMCLGGDRMIMKNRKEEGKWKENK